MRLFRSSLYMDIGFRLKLCVMPQFEELCIVNFRRWQIFSVALSRCMQKHLLTNIIRIFITPPALVYSPPYMLTCSNIRFNWASSEHDCPTATMLVIKWSSRDISVPTIYEATPSISLTLYRLCFPNANISFIVIVSIASEQTLKPCIKRPSGMAWEPFWIKTYAYY